MANVELKNKLLQTINNLKENPDKAEVSFNAKTELINGLLTNASVRKFNFNIDEPKELGGTDVAPNPVEYILAALGSCQEIVYAAYAEVLGIELSSVKINVKGKLNLKGLFGLDENVVPGFSEITYDTQIVSNEDPNKIKELVQLVESHCPVQDTLTRAVKVNGNVKINNQPLAA